MVSNMNSVSADVIKAVSEIVRDKDVQVTLAVAAFLSSGHVLIEDTPGTGKTSMRGRWGIISVSIETPAMHQ